jgi:hypothetical protein
MTDVLCVVLPSTISDLTGDYRVERVSRNEVAKAVSIKSDVHAFTKGKAASQGTRVAPSLGSGILDREQIKPRHIHEKSTMFTSPVYKGRLTAFIRAIEYSYHSNSTS